MKTNFKKPQGILVLIASLLLLTACQNEDSETITEETSMEVLAKQSAEIDIMSDDIGIIVEEANQEDESVISFLPACVTITTQISQGFRERTLDFGTGCELPNGNIISGSITMRHEIDTNPFRRDISVTFSNFYHNDVLIEGTRSVERVAANDVGNPQATAAVDMQVTWPDGSTATRVGTRVREWIDGVGSGTWADNVFSITGNVTTTGRLGNTFSTNITTPLRRELACAFMVSGTVELSLNGNTGVLSYGNGDCDNEASWTNPSGNTQTIYLN